MLRLRIMKRRRRRGRRPEVMEEVGAFGRFERRRNGVLLITGRGLLAIVAGKRKRRRRRRRRGRERGSRQRPGKD